MLAAIFIAAIFLRFEHLGSIPQGVSGDEAVSGLETRRVLHEGWIGLYSPLAAGQPTGVFYIMSLSFRLFSDSILSLRLVSAIAGILSVGVLYAIVRRNLGANVAFVACALFAVSGWDLHLSRYAVPAGTWPLIVVIVMGVAVEALHTGSRRWWISLGFSTGIGIYIYDAHVFFAALVFVFVALMVMRSSARRSASLLAGLTAATVTVLPMGIKAIADPHGYLAHFRTSSIFGQSSWSHLESLSEQVRFLGGRYFGYWDRLCCHPTLDGIDGTGLVAMVPWAMTLLVVLGVGLAVWRLRGDGDPRTRLLLMLALWLTILSPISASISEGGEVRRTVPVLVALCIFAALPVAQVGAWTSLLSLAPRAAVLAVGVLTALAVYQSSQVYPSFVDSDAVDGIFYRDLSAASRFMNDLPESAYVYFFYDRTSLGYETRLYLAPKVRGEDRSSEFGTFNLEIHDAVGDPVFVLLGKYIDSLDELKDIYPEGETVTGEGTPIPFVAYMPSSPR
jgi:4-amino-4-deoxy-L-arabinose transferase-like glycosyltransferase